MLQQRDIDRGDVVESDVGRKVEGKRRSTCLPPYMLEQSPDFNKETADDCEP